MTIATPPSARPGKTRHRPTSTTLSCINNSHCTCAAENTDYPITCLHATASMTTYRLQVIEEWDLYQICHCEWIPAWNKQPGSPWTYEGQGEGLPAVRAVRSAVCDPSLQHEQTHTHITHQNNQTHIITHQQASKLNTMHGRTGGH